LYELTNIFSSRLVNLELDFGKCQCLLEATQTMNIEVSLVNRSVFLTKALKQTNQ